MELNRDDMRERLVTRGPFEEVTFQQREKTFGCQRKWDVLGADSRPSALGHRTRVSGVRRA